MRQLPSHNPEDIVRLGEKIGFSQLIENYELADNDIASIDKRLSVVDWCGLALFQKLSEHAVYKYKAKLCWLFVKQKQTHIDKNDLMMMEVEAALDEDKEE
jgi:hypothetical protein